MIISFLIQWNEFALTNFLKRNNKEAKVWSFINLLQWLVLTIAEDKICKL